MDILLELALRSSVPSFQMTYPSAIQLPAELPTVRVPRKPKIFLDRDGDIDAIAASLNGEKAAHIAILGADGLGKTSLAAAVWHSQVVEKRYGKNRVWISCDGLMSDEGLVPSLAAAFSIPDDHRDQLRNRILQYLPSHDTPALLVLDNYRSPPNTVDHGTGGTLLNELANISHLSLLFTVGGTQHPAGIEWSQPVLPPLGALDPLTSRAVYLAYGGKDEDQLEDLLALLEGSPLAIGLAVKQNQTRSAAELVQAYGQQKISMVGRDNSIPLNSLELIIHLALDSQPMRNSPQSLQVLSMLSLLPDGIEVEQLSNAFPSVPELDQALQVLEQLGFIAKWGNRIRVFSALRPSVLARCSPTDAENVKAMRASFCAFLDNISINPPDTPTLERLTKEFSNITSLLAYALHQPNPHMNIAHEIQLLCVFKAHARYCDCKPLVTMAVEELIRQQLSNPAAVYLTISLACSLMAQREWNDAATLLEQVDPKDIPPHLEATRLILYAILHLTQHRFQDVTKFLQQALGLEAGHASLQAAIIEELLAGISFQQGNLDEAESHCAAAEPYYISSDNKPGSYRCQELRAKISVERRKYVDAFQIFYELLHTYTEAGLDYGRARIQRALYRIHYLDGRYEAALTGYSDAKDKAEKANDKFAIAICERGSARTYELMQQPAAALELYKHAISLFQGLDAVIEVAYTRLDLGHCMCDSQLPAEGLSQMAAAMAAFDYYGLKYPSAKCKQYSGKVLASLKAVNEGLSRLRIALGAFLDLGRKVDAADCYITIGGVCFQNQLAEAEEATKSAMSLYDEVGQLDAKANCTVILASHYRQRGMAAEAARAAQEGLDILAALDDRSKADEGIVQMLKGFLAPTSEMETEE
ncbi:hypothetical protein CALVIDRAFT_569096 [Calocera viscosa TUFC12733]|uniref:NB-ARC domain-containing protein n=1 Tax=Calocera viscosa (strain TUFC12733) TaxID=1330018 RepID=A0A167GBH4_CALVF|nr:hypothetical protein CALVIDRAFT_569096 [Calocera viscosa TUFC12733]